MSEMDEDKQKICDLLLPALQATRGGGKVVALKYNPDDKETNGETVTVVFQSGWKKVADVTADSGTALIFDVMRQIF